MASRNLEDLHPKVKHLAELFISKCSEAGIDVLITSTYRSIEEQNVLYAKGRTTKGTKVTNAKGGQSFHNFRVAFDFVPIVNGKPDWNNLTTFSKCGEIGESIGLEWAGRWTKFKEFAHFQFTEGLTLKDFQAGKTI